ncbi:cAMP-binding domain of CRP or a regulatory subunit of cAMP-dependent protein kinases [Pedobacter westerhofensis]|uniref:cAMP-binding domain of CRP or a regulatory subunit of cAMP-dependent protein kinases n=1 Tax=Pedobacter westerhofensis TaxID=425512 RepID=A0A521BRH7_9SPHI|nr:Crp/Fnr family transcriptional regulator [Pedobacter westerhofensis]SMO49140.1 cAMP-binding domain of CRP or a regulatory subunit of cAMP-dependent protein kinases [Pedobacter westerhofensis]
MYNQLSDYVTSCVSISEDDLKLVLSCFRPLSAKKKELIEIEGDPVKRMYFVVKGYLRIYFLKPDGAEVTRRFAFEKRFSTCLVSFVTGETLVESTQAIVDSELLFISRKDFYHLVETIPAWENFYRKYLEGAYVTNTNRLQRFITLDASQRYKLLLQENPEVILRLSNKLVANYLNISQEALSRIKSKV